MNETFYTEKQLSSRYHTFVRPYNKADGLRFNVRVPLDILTSQIIRCGIYAVVEYVDQETGEILEMPGVYGHARKQA